MEDNPYSTILNTIRTDADGRSHSAWRMGEVVTVDPLVIKTGENLLSGKDLWVNYQIRENTEPANLYDINGVLKGSVDCTIGSISQMSISDGNIQVTGLFGGILHEGDTVAMLESPDSQEFVVLCRVVRA